MGKLGAGKVEGARELGYYNLTYEDLRRSS